MADLFNSSLFEPIKIGETLVNRIGLGTNKVTDSPEVRDFLNFATTSGVNFIDTAFVYSGGNSETTIGVALSPYPENLIVATKGGMSAGTTGNNSEEFLRSNIETSLRRLKVDHISLYQLHRLDKSQLIQRTMAILKSFQAEGKVDRIGLSEVNVSEIEEAQKYIDITSVQNEYSLNNKKHEAVLDYCHKNNIVFIPWFPLRGLRDKPDLMALLEKLSLKYSKDIEQIALCWLLMRSPWMLPIPGTLSKGHLAKNIEATKFTLEDEDFNALANI